MSFQARLWLGVAQLCITENFLQYRSQTWIISLKLCACIDVIVNAIVFAIVVKPTLHTFGKILTIIAPCVGALPQAFCESLIVTRLEFFIKLGIDALEPAQMNVVRKLVNHDVFRAIRIALEG